jgi:hypothetical protein
MKEKKEYYVQVGVTALRTPTGRHYPAIPLYIKVDHLKPNGLAKCEEKMLTDIAGFFSDEYSKHLLDEELNKTKE